MQRRSTIADVVLWWLMHRIEVSRLPGHPVVVSINIGAGESLCMLDGMRRLITASGDYSRFQQSPREAGRVERRRARTLRAGGF